MESTGAGNGAESGSRVSSKLPPSVQNILLDIEGTTTSIKFVTETLFPYARRNLSKYLDQNWTNSEVQDIVALLRTQCKEDEANGLQGVQKILDSNETTDTEEIKSGVIKNVLWQMDHDRKSTALKELQGKMWKGGFVSGELRGHVFDDVPEAFKRWKESGKNIYIYSSGSVEAQKLLFGHSIAGDLTKQLSAYFDTTTGPKRESKSYELIAASIESPPQSIIFFTDIPAEAVAAKGAGLQVCLLDRPGNFPLTDEDKQAFHIVNDFNAF